MIYQSEGLNGQAGKRSTTQRIDWWRYQHRFRLGFGYIRMVPMAMCGLGTMRPLLCTGGTRVVSFLFTGGMSQSRQVMFWKHMMPVVHQGVGDCHMERERQPGNGCIKSQATHHHKELSGTEESMSMEGGDSSPPSSLLVFAFHNSGAQDLGQPGGFLAQGLQFGEVEFVVNNVA